MEDIEARPVDPTGYRQRGDGRVAPAGEPLALTLARAAC